MLAFVGLAFLFLWFVVGLLVLGGLAYGVYWIVGWWNDDASDTDDQGGFGDDDIR